MSGEGTKRFHNVQALTCCRLCEQANEGGRGVACAEGWGHVARLRLAVPRLTLSRLVLPRLTSLCVLCVLSLKRSNCKWQSKAAATPQQQQHHSNNNTTTTTAVIVVMLISSTAQVLCHESFRCPFPSPQAKPIKLSCLFFSDIYLSTIHIIYIQSISLAQPEPFKLAPIASDTLPGS